MRFPSSLLLSLTITAAAAATFLGCGPNVQQTSTGGHTTTATETTTGTNTNTPTPTTSTTTTTGCNKPEPVCVPGCGGDVIGQAKCVNDAWQCEPGWMFIDDCPAGSCFGLPYPCETCPNGWACEPNAACVGSCDGVVCLECPAAGGQAIFGACECHCTDSGEYTCKLAGGCCNEDLDCGDEVFVPCVNHVCKQPTPTGCWSDAECPPGKTCQGASVCGCGQVCGAPDMPGQCAP